MKVEIEPGKYVVAVSGGVDSVVLLHLLKGSPGLNLVVAHYDHGIRTNSREDCEFVANLAKEYGLEFYYAEGNLRSDASENLARSKRYEFLRDIKARTSSGKIITAHHQDDVIETAILNLLRGSGRRGLSSLKSTDEIARPLLPFSKSEILDYANANNLKWHEDETNKDLRYARNYLRYKVIPNFTADQRTEFLGIISGAGVLNQQIDNRMNELISSQLNADQLNRHFFIMLPHAVAKELLATWLRGHEVRDLSSNMLERLTIQSKTLAFGQQTDIDKCHHLKIERDILALYKSKC